MNSELAPQGGVSCRIVGIKICLALNFPTQDESKKLYNLCVHDKQQSNLYIYSNTAKHLCNSINRRNHEVSGKSVEPKLNTCTCYALFTDVSHTMLCLLT